MTEGILVRLRGKTRRVRGFQILRPRVETLEGRMLLTGSTTLPAGSLDPIFGSAGLVLSSLAVGNAQINALAVQTDGKIVAVGNLVDQATPSLSHWVVARYNTAGAIDSTFGTGGFVETSFLGNDNAESVAIAPDGSIVVGGASGPTAASSVAVLARYQANGSLDTSFGPGGMVQDVGKNLSAVTSLALYGNKIVVTGPTVLLDHGLFEVARLVADGLPDSSFGTYGVATDSFGTGSIDVSLALAVAPDGSVAVGGQGENGGASQTSRAPLMIFSSAGVKTHEVIGLPVGTTYNLNVITSLAIQTDGKIVAAGYYTNDNTGSKNFIVSRYNSDLTPDDSFGTQGRVLSPFPGNTVGTVGVGIQLDAKIVVGGGGGSFIVQRLNPRGDLDLTFGNAGVAQIDVGQGQGAKAGGFALQADGNILIAGSALGPGNLRQSALARLLGKTVQTPLPPIIPPVLPPETPMVVGEGLHVKAPTARWFRHPVAVFHLTLPSGSPRPTATAFLEKIQWGDGTSSSGTAVRLADGSFKVLGSHRYPHRRIYYTTVQIFARPSLTSLAILHGQILAGGH